MPRRLVDKLQSFFPARQKPKLMNVTMRLPGHDASLAGLRIGQLSDIHLGPVVSAAYVQEAVKLLMEHKPDLIALTGDFVSRSSSYARFIPEALEGLSAPLGVYAVRGNHDLWVSHPEHILDALEASGVEVLLNRGKAIEQDGTALWLAGIDDVWEKKHELDVALKDAPDELPHLLLCHEPDFAVDAAREGVSLQLSGHTHGGQIRLAGRPLVRPLHGRQFIAGLYELAAGEMQLYVNRGIGAGFPPLRIGVPPEVTMVTLKG